MSDDVYKQEPDGSWSPAKPMGYFWDARPLWKKVLEFPLRLVGLIRYDPLIEIPYGEYVSPERNKVIYECVSNERRTKARAGASSPPSHRKLHRATRAIIHGSPHARQ